MTLLHRAFEIAHFINPNGGTALEFGVFRGRSYAYQAREIQKRYRKSKIVGFDSWQGLPEETDGVWAPARHDAGEFQAPKDEVASRMKKLGIKAGDPQFRLVDGFFSDSLTPELLTTIDNVIFLNIDVDIHSSTVELLDWVRPKLQPGTVIYWDDWRDPNDIHEGKWGVHLAWEQWLERNPGVKYEIIEVNAVEQRTMIVTEVDGKTMVAPQPSLRDIRFEGLRIGDRPQRPRQFMLSVLREEALKRPKIQGFARRMADKYLTSR